MANMLTGAMGQLATALGNNAGTTVTYRRSGQEVSLAATKCPVRSEIDPTFGILRINECDWIIKAALIVLDSVTVEPQKNDVIEEADGQRWQVLPLDNAEQEFRPLDPYRTAFRIHTKRIDAG